MKKYLFAIYERLYIFGIFTIFTAISFLILVGGLIDYTTSEISFGKFISLMLSSLFLVSFIFIFIYSFVGFQFSFIIFKDEEIVYNCHRNKFNKKILYKNIKSIYIDEFCYGGIRRIAFSKFIVISCNRFLSAKKGKIKDNVIKMFKSRDYIIIPYSEELYQSILNKIETKNKEN